MRVVPELQQQQKQQQQRREEQEGRGGKMNLDLRLTEEQEEYLELQFKKSKNPHPSELMLTAAETGLLEEEVQVSGGHTTLFHKRNAQATRNYCEEINRM